MDAMRKQAQVFVRSLFKRAAGAGSPGIMGNFQLGGTESPGVTGLGGAGGAAGAKPPTPTPSLMPAASPPAGGGMRPQGAPGGGPGSGPMAAIPHLGSPAWPGAASYKGKTPQMPITPATAAGHSSNMGSFGTGSSFDSNQPMGKGGPLGLDAMVAKQQNVMGRPGMRGLAMTPDQRQLRTPPAAGPIFDSGQDASKRMAASGFNMATGGRTAPPGGETQVAANRAQHPVGTQGRVWSDHDLLHGPNHPRRAMGGYGGSPMGQSQGRRPIAPPPAANEPAASAAGGGGGTRATMQAGLDRVRRYGFQPAAAAPDRVNNEINPWFGAPSAVAGQPPAGQPPSGLPRTATPQAAGNRGVPGDLTAEQQASAGPPYGPGGWGNFVRSFGSHPHRPF